MAGLWLRPAQHKGGCTVGVGRHRTASRHVIPPRCAQRYYFPRRLCRLTTDSLAENYNAASAVLHNEMPNQGVGAGEAPWSHSRRDIFMTSNFAGGHVRADDPGPGRAAKEGRLGCGF